MNTPAETAAVGEGEAGKEARAAAGMERRWQRHFPYGRWIVLGGACWRVGAVVVTFMALLWSQVLYPRVLDSSVAFQAVVDAQDDAALDRTYTRWLRELYYGEEEKLGEYALHSFNIWSVNNPAAVVEDGSYPELTAVGPIGYVRHTTKYDVEFSDDDGRYTSYKSWRRFAPTASADDCREMFFRMDKAAMLINTEDCPGSTCSCVNITKEATVINPPFLRLLDELTPVGMLSTLAQEAFHKIRGALTGGFVHSVKSALLPSVLADRWRQRRAYLVLNSVLQDVFNAIVAADGADVAVAAFAASLGDYSVPCGNHSVAGYDYCPWATADAVADAWETATGSRELNLSISQAEWLLGLGITTLGSLFDANNGTALWVAAGRYLGDLDAEDMPSPPSGASDEEVYEALVAAMCDADGIDSGSSSSGSSNSSSSGGGSSSSSTGDSTARQECKAKVAGVSAFLFGIWEASAYRLNSLVVEEWLTGNTSVTCDAAGGLCPWPLNAVNGTSDSGSSKYRGTGGGSKVPSAAATMLILKPPAADEDPASDLSIHAVRSLNYWRNAWVYCTATPGAACDEVAGYLAAANGTLAPLLRAADGAELAATTSAAEYLEQVCTVASWLFDTWAGSSGSVSSSGGDSSGTTHTEPSWSDAAVARYLTLSLWNATAGYDISAQQLSDIGYVQWASGAVTEFLYHLPSISTVARKGIWAFTDADYQADTPELWSRAALNGYPDVTIGVTEAKELLILLAEDSDSGDSFRRSVLAASTTYFGRSGHSFSEVFDGGSYHATFYDGDAAFIEQNVEADFITYVSDAAAGSRGLAAFNVSDGLLALLNTTYESSVALCRKVQALYTACAAQVKKRNYWPRNCDIFKTTLTGGSVDCGKDTIGIYFHPRAIKVGNIVAGFAYNVAWERVLKGGGYVCSNTDTDNCDHSGGGLFKTVTARELLFDGYLDPLVNKLLNKRIAHRGLEVRCAGAPVVESYDTRCRATFSETCGDDGIEVVHADLGVLVQAARDLGASTGSNATAAEAVAARWRWHSAELELPHGLGSVRNPAWAVYPGGDWNNEAFQKDQDCQQRTLQGPIGLWDSCATTVATGRGAHDRAGHAVRARGNATLWAGLGTNGSLTVGGTLSVQFPQLGYDGLAAYSVPYGVRTSGSEASGASFADVLAPAQLMRFAMSPDDTDSPASDVESPTRYTYNDAAAGADAVIKVNRYAQRIADWSAARRRGGGGYLRDFNGVEYDVPEGMASLAPLAGFATAFVSDPYYYTNKLAGAQDYFRLLGDIQSPDAKLHRSFVDIEPVTGLALRSALRMQLGFRWERTAFVPESVSEYCRVPTRDTMDGGFGCFIYVPLLWTNDERAVDATTARWIADGSLATPSDVRDTAVAALAAGGLLLAGGAALTAIFGLREKRFRRKVYVD